MKIPWVLGIITTRSVDTVVPGINDLVKLEFRMKMPADSTEGIPVRHHGEGFTRPNLNQFQIGSHVFLPTPVI